jgi:AcrR family transcriptional regulator
LRLQASACFHTLEAMTPAPAPTTQGQRTRERILSAAATLFAERGFASVTIRAIGDTVGIDNSSLYRHFKSKSALAHAVLDRCGAELAHELGPISSRITPTLSGLVSVATAVGMALWDRPETARLILHLILGWRDEPTGFRVSIRMDESNSDFSLLFRGFAQAYVTATQAGEVRAAAWPEIFIALFGVLALRPATRGSLLVSQEPDRSDEEAREAWRVEIETVLRASLSP